MAYDLLIKNGRIVDGSGMPAFKGDVGVKDGKIVEIGKLSGPADKTIDAAGMVVAPGFVDNHCHFDAQVTWDPLCTFSPQHGATTVILREAGFNDTANLAGGMLRWRSEGHPVEGGSAMEYIAEYSI